MTEFLLVLAFFAGPMVSATSGVSVSQVGPFTTRDECNAAGIQLTAKFGSNVKSASFECIERKKPVPTS